MENVERGKCRKKREKGKCRNWKFRRGKRRNKNIEKENAEEENVKIDIIFFLIYDKYCVLLI